MFPGSLRVEYTLPVPASSTLGQQQIMTVFRHYESAITKAGGKRLNIAPSIESWFDVNAKLFVYEVPTPEGPRQLGLWLQSGGAEQFLMFIAPPRTDKAVAGDELAQRLKAFGRVPLYLQFDTGRAELKADGRQVVQDVVALMRAEPALQLSVEGHTDNVGQAASNQTLSQARAAAVRDAIVAQGIAAKRLAATGHGQGRPIADNGVEAGRAVNRRVELVRVMR